MKSNTVERVTEWDSEPFSGGYDGLRELADREFTGAATDGSAWLFMLNGRVLGCFDGDIGNFEDADGTVYEAPAPALPLLFAMQETGGETRAEYYSEETPLSEVNGTLESGNFTGYVELSENVLSGDYYVAYYGGRSLPVAFVGNQGERLSGDEAFERADDEVGIYQVNTVELDITDIPGGEGESSTSGGVNEAEPEEAEEPASTASEANPETESEFESESEPASEPEPAAEADEKSESPGEAPEPASVEEAEPSERATGESAADAEPDRGTATTEESERTGGRSQTTSGRSERRERTERTEQSVRTAGQSEPGPTEPGTAEEQRWRGAKTIPALDPEESVDMAEEVPGDVEPAAAASTAATAQPRRRAEDEAAIEELEAERNRLQERVEELAAEAEELEMENEQLREERDRLERERDEAQAKVTELENEIDELRSTVDRLESELSTAESELAEVEQYMPEGDHDVSADRALDGTNLFVRYDRQGGATLEDAHDGDAARDDVNDNLRLEHHTDFDQEGAIVEGEPFEEWLQSTMEYGFGRWLVEEFIHDVRETRNQSSLGKLYDAVPEIDRIEFRGAVDLPSEETDEEAPETATFDVVLRDRMGSPLVVADLNDSREAATESMLGTLLENATPVAKAHESLASAFFVTTSYFDPGALETAEEATGSGFLSRDKSKSFVKLSRKGGYHLCLVETREGEFHVSVPEL